MMKPMGRLMSNSVQLVADLIDHDSGQWNVELVRETFPSPDADASYVCRDQKELWRFFGLGPGIGRDNTRSDQLTGS